MPLFDEIEWRDPVGGKPMVPIVSARTPAGVPIAGALRIEGTDLGYPIVDCVVRATPDLASRHAEWLKALGLRPAGEDPAQNGLQSEATVDSFGWQWTWNSSMRNDDDLLMRVVTRWEITPDLFLRKVVLDAGAGAGDQSAYLVRNGARVVSVDLSSAIDVVARKLRMDPNWTGVQGDVTALPFRDAQFDVVYCEGVIQHTRDSQMTVDELLRVTVAGGYLLASHYVRPLPQSRMARARRKVTVAYYDFARRRLSAMGRYPLMLTTGILAALSYVPLLGLVIRRSGTALYYDLMPEFKTTWANTFDFYGNHSFQRFITPEEFWSYFEKNATADLCVRKPGVVVARKRSTRGNPASSTNP